MRRDRNKMGTSAKKSEDTGRTTELLVPVFFRFPQGSSPPTPSLAMRSGSSSRYSHLEKEERIFEFLFLPLQQCEQLPGDTVRPTSPRSGSTAGDHPAQAPQTGSDSIRCEGEVGANDGGGWRAIESTTQRSWTTTGRNFTEVGDDLLPNPTKARMICGAGFFRGKAR